jgi:hypothetical protein
MARAVLANKLVLYMFLLSNLLMPHLALYLVQVLLLPDVQYYISEILPFLFLRLASAHPADSYNVTSVPHSLSPPSLLAPSVSTATTQDWTECLPVGGALDDSANKPQHVTPKLSTLTQTPSSCSSGAQPVMKTPETTNMPQNSLVPATASQQPLLYQGLTVNFLL